MADNNIKNSLGGFDVLVDEFLSSSGSPKKMDTEDNESVVDPEDIKKEMESLDIKTPSKKKDSEGSANDKNKNDIKIPDKNEEESDEDEDLDDESEEESDEEGVSGEEEEDIEEVELVTAFSDLFAAELGWEFAEGEKPQSTKDIVKFMRDIIETNSQPKYASNEIKELDDFVKQGGRTEDFFKRLYSTEVNIDNINIEKESNQKLIIRENLRNRGYSEARIDKLITRYEENGALEDEAKDSLEEVKEYREKTRRELLDDQKKLDEQNTREQLKFIQNVEEIIKNAKDIRGIPISDKDRNGLIEYIFKPEQDGATKYQKDYASNLNNLVESAYFTMKKDTFVKQIEKQASTNAIKDLKLKLKTKGKSTKNAASDQEEGGTKVMKLWELASRDLLTKS